VRAQDLAQAVIFALFAWTKAARKGCPRAHLTADFIFGQVDGWR
jgi:hypothetical protein